MQTRSSTPADMLTNRLFFATCAMTATERSNLQAVKVCGVVHPYDVGMTAELFARVNVEPASLYIGMILQPKSIRSIDTSKARQLSEEAKRNGATPVAVFLEEDVDQIDQICDICDIQVAQLHGHGSKQSFIENGGKLKSCLDWINVQDVLESGQLAEENHEILQNGHGNGGKCLWTLYDAIPPSRGGSGRPFEWNAFTTSESPWFLAGGLGPGNVREAIKCLRPHGLDAAGGLCGTDKKRKDASRLLRFFEEIKYGYAGK